MFVLRVAKALDKAKVPYAIVGGYAVALHGAVRGTIDVDVVLKLELRHFVNAEKALRSIGLEPRLPVTAQEVFEFRREYIERRNLVAWSFHHPSSPGEVVDVVITHDLSSMKTIQVRMGTGGMALPVVGVADLIRMKTESGRPQDLEDIRALKAIAAAKERAPR